MLGAGPGAPRPGTYTLFVLKDGLPLLAVPVTSADFQFSFPSAGPGRYRLQVQRESAIEAVSSPIWVEPAAYARPKGASPVYASLVPAYLAAKAPNAAHAPPLDFSSCRPPVAESGLLTIGTPDANGKPAVAVASAKFAARVGDPSTATDEADVAVSVSAIDVRCRMPAPACPGGAGTDFSGTLLARTNLRVTDHGNGLTVAGGSDPATVSDVPLEIPTPCTATTGTIGGSCAVSTTVDSVLPGAVREGSRAIWELGAVELADPGPNGTGYESGCPSTCGDGDEASVHAPRRGDSLAGSWSYRSPEDCSGRSRTRAIHPFSSSTRPMQPPLLLSITKTSSPTRGWRGPRIEEPHRGPDATIRVRLVEIRSQHDLTLGEVELPFLATLPFLPPAPLPGSIPIVDRRSSSGGCAGAA